MQRIEATSPPITDATSKKQTGKTLKEWFKAIDDIGGKEKGRRAVTEFLNGKEGIDEWWMTTLAVEYENARGIVEKDGKPKGYSPCASKTINAPMDKVFAAWSSAKAVERWFSKKAKWEFKPGGRFESAEGDCGEFLKVRENKDIKLTWETPDLAAGTTVEVQFHVKSADKTTIYVNHMRIQKREDADVLRASWGAALDKLKAVLEAK